MASTPTRTTSYGRSVTEREAALMRAALALVGDWRDNLRRADLRNALLEVVERYLEPVGLSRADYTDLRMVANAIRTGRGHPIDNPDPLIELLRSRADHGIA